MAEQLSRYHYYKSIFKTTPMPFAFVDLDLFDENIRAIQTRASGKPIRIASKSIRCTALLRRIQAASSQFRGLMSYSVREALFLIRNGFDDILVAYPVWREAGMAELCEVLKEGKTLVLMVDCAEHVERLEQIGAAANTPISVCMDIDMSTHFPGVHFGVRRSGMTTPEQALALWNVIRKCPHVSLVGVMGYEAQIASLQDDLPNLKSQVIRFLKKRSIPKIAARRRAVITALRDAGACLQFVNGGGTGSIESTRLDDLVTEITVGSGFYSPALFDHFRQFNHQPAAGFAIEIVRCPSSGTYTCHGGGYIASGSAGPDKLPKPYLPDGARLIPQEGAGEVQTPFRYQGPERLELGDPIFMRHAKAGELCERFNTLLLISEGKIIDEVPTYRGEGACFL